MPAYTEIAKQVVRTGKKEPKEDERNLKMARYLPKRALHRLPGSVKRSGEVARALAAAGQPVWGMMRNDALGDCTCASFGHMEQTWTAVATPNDQPWTPGDSEVEALYNLVNGGRDEGAYMLDVNNKMREVGLGGRKIEAFVAIDPDNIDHIKYAIDEFGSAYVGVWLPESAQTQTRWKLVHGPGSEPGSWGGHAINLVDYDRNGPYCVTWGEVVGMTWGFWKKYGDEAYAIISSDWLTDGKSPRGFNMDRLMQDLSAIA